MNSVLIVPTLFSNSIPQMIEQYKKLQNEFSYFHIDIMSNDFVSQINLDISNSNEISNFKELCSLLHSNNHRAEIHLMVKNVVQYIEFISSQECISSIIIHYESFNSKEELEYVIEHILPKYSKISFQLAISPNSVVEDIITLISKFSKIMVMGVFPGKQSQEFIESRINVIVLLLKLGVNVGIDGGLNEHAISNILLKTKSILNQSINNSNGGTNNLVTRLQLNVGSFFNQVKSDEELNSKISVLNNQLKLMNLQQEQYIASNPYVIIIDIGGTHTKLYIGSFEEFKVEEIQVFNTNEFKSSKELFQRVIKSIGVHTIVDYVILGIAGEKHTNIIKMTHENLEFNMDVIEQQFPQFREILLFNDCELAGFGVKGSKEYLQYKKNIEFENKKNLSLEDTNYLELLVVIGTGVGIAHISNEGVSYNSQGGHIITQFEDILYSEFLHKELDKKTISFDDVISARGLEMRYMYDTDEYKNTYDILKLAKQKDEKVTKTINFFLQELIYFLQDCIYFDNIITNLYLGGEFLCEIVELFKIYKEKEFIELENRCNIITIHNDYLQFLGGLQIVHNKLNIK
ncbi:MAG: glucokinase [Nanoarchaeota archaeon]|nr:glucokinase [Nanoarchaeota archaeon]